jgi:hypothetical protein
MVTQTTYPTTMPKGQAGMKANAEDWNAITRTCETVAGIAFGVPVSRGAADFGCIIAAAATKILGISIKDITRPAADGDKYARYSNVGILTMGVIWVVAGGACTAGNPAYWDPATGKWVNDNTKLAVPGAVFDSTGVLNDLVLVAIR